MSLSKFRLLDLFPSYPDLNRFVTLLYTALPAVLGSGVSVTYQGGALWCAFEVLSGRRKLNWDPPAVRLTIAIYAFVLVNVISTVANGGPSYLLQLVSVVALLGFPTSYSVWTISRREDIANAAIVGSAISCIGAMAIAIIQYNFLRMRAEGGAGNALVFATVICLAVSMVLAGLFHVDARWRKYLSAAAVAGIIALVYSGSRIAWLALGLAAIIILVVNRRSILSNMSSRAVAVVALIILALALIAAIPVADRVQRLVNDWYALQANGDYSTSLGVRAALWQIGWGLFREAPLLGHGQAQTVDLITRGFREQFGLTQAFTHFHNGFLTTAVEAGLFGLATLLAIFAVALHNAISFLRHGATDLERLGATVLLTTVTLYVCIGSANILLGHDILDVMFLLMLAIGTFLGSGKSMLTDRAGKGFDSPTPAGGDERPPEDGKVPA